MGGIAKTVRCDFFFTGFTWDSNSQTCPLPADQQPWAIVRCDLH